MMGIHMRFAIRRDIPEILEIERTSFASPWSEEEFLRQLRCRNCICLVAEQGEKVVGYVVYEIFKTRLHVLNLAVRPDRRRRGVGATILKRLVSKLCGRRPRITLVVSEANLPSQVFYRWFGFRATKVLRTYYRDEGLDGYYMQYALAGTAANRMSQYLAPSEQEGPKGPREER